MKLNFDNLLLDFNGESIKDSNTQKEISLRIVAINALIATIEGIIVEPMKKFERYKLAEKVHAGGMVEVTAEEISEIEDCVGRAYSVVVVGAAYKLLEESK